jgi:membrane dipeptidase
MSVSDAAQNLFDESLIVDMTAPGSPLALLVQSPMATEEWIRSYEEAGCSWVSFTVASDHFARTIESCITTIATARNWFLARPERFVFVEKADDIVRAKSEGKMAVSIHFQGTVPFQRDVRLVEVYKRLGVVHALMAYNNKNLVGDGCHERTDSGLSVFGLELIAEMNRVGMLVDVTHTGHRTAMEAIEASTAPVIMSHSSPSAVFEHPRNVPDDQIVATAKSGGVIGVHGVGIFLSAGGLDISAGRIVDFIEHSVDLVGPQHVGLGLDYVMHTEPLKAAVASSKGVYSKDGGYYNEEILFASAAVIPEIAEILLQKNYSEADVKGILGENWMRVFREVWG